MSIYTVQTFGSMKLLIHALNYRWMTHLTEIIVKSFETKRYNQNKLSEESQTGSSENLGAMLHAWIYRIICRNHSKTLPFFTKMQKEIQLYYAY